VFGAVWIILTLGMQGLYEWAYDFPKLALFVKTGYEYLLYIPIHDLYTIQVKEHTKPDRKFCIMLAPCVTD